MNKLINEYSLSDTFAYLDNITVGGKTQEDHNTNVAKFLDMISELGLTLNEAKTISSVSQVKLLGYCISYGQLKPDPERLQPLLDLPAPSESASLKRIVGMFSYYSNWIYQFSKKIQPLAKTELFPLSNGARKSFMELKQDIANSVLCSINEEEAFVIETDASDHAIAATLSQKGRPVAFFTRTLNHSERNHSSIEKEAYAIIEATRKWRHYVGARHFTLITDQKSVAFMFHKTQHGKIKNDKILRWRIELSSYSFDIQYRPGKDNVAADTFSKAFCSSLSYESLLKLHDNLCHPGITRISHFIRSKNLPYTTEEVKRVTTQCKTCAELKPQYYKPSRFQLIKATKPFERLNVDFKGPLPSNTKNKYILTVIDEHSRFPFAFPCPNVESKTVIKCLELLFSMFGMPNYIHSDRGLRFSWKN